MLQVTIRTLCLHVKKVTRIRFIILFYLLILFYLFISGDECSNHDRKKDAFSNPFDKGLIGNGISFWFSSKDRRLPANALLDSTLKTILKDSKIKTN